MKRILFIEPQPCIRALKLAYGLKWLWGKEISLVFGYQDKTLTEFYGYGDEFFDEFVLLSKDNPEKSISELVKNYKPDIIHSHNAPDFLTLAALNSVEDTPIIHDTHDALTMRKTRYSLTDSEERVNQYAVEERIANEKSNGRIYITKGVQDYIRGQYSVDSGVEIIFNNYVPKDIIPQQLEKKLSSSDGETHIVYAGTISSQIEGHHYDLRGIFKEIADHHFHIHIYAAREDEVYERLAQERKYIHYHGHLDQRVLMKELTRYDYGWTGFNDAKNKTHLDVCLPNKAFEYIACGLPVLSYSHKTLTEFIEQNKVGFILDNFNLEDKLEESEAVRENVLQKRYSFTVENNIERLSKFYQTFSV
ncbi:MAG: glycosyltransferase [Candidatus Bathyarchaeota archaeon]|nr:glycosyltransferase [Candidatus Bathyarchaeota archaeon]